MRVLHVSDVHVDVPLMQMPARSWSAPKRLLGGLNLTARRRPYFRDARAKLAQLAEFARAEAVDLVICTGDFTALGTEPEIVAARRAVEPLTEVSLGLVAVPGNHDVYVADSRGRFERVFGDLLSTDLPELAVDGSLWPFVRLFGDSVAVVGVNSARPNPQPWRSSGRIPDAQIEALPEILADERLTGRFVFVITHYAPRLADGGPDRFSHGLRNADEFLDACASLERGAILHGHVHRHYSVRVPEASVPLFCSGSSTQAGSEGFWLFEIGSEASAQSGRYDGERYVLEGPPQLLAGM